MRRVPGVVFASAALACSGSSPSAPEAFVPLASFLGGASADHGTAHGPVTVFNTQMRSELESPACNSVSSGHAQVQVNPDGTIDSRVTINNKGVESVRFGHIHHLNTGAATGPIIWWLSSPIGTDLNLTDRHLQFAQQGAFVTNTHFTDHDAALAALLANPDEFYVNFHSDLCPGGFARGFLPSITNTPRSERSGHFRYGNMSRMLDYLRKSAQVARTQAESGAARGSFRLENASTVTQGSTSPSMPRKRSPCVLQTSPIPSTTIKLLTASGPVRRTPMCRSTSG